MRESRFTFEVDGIKYRHPYSGQGSQPVGVDCPRRMFELMCDQHGFTINFQDSPITGCFGCESVPE